MNRLEDIAEDQSFGGTNPDLSSLASCSLRRRATLKTLLGYLAEDAVCSRVCERRGKADFVVIVSIWVLISCASNGTLERGVEKSRGVLEALVVLRTRLFAKREGEKSEERKLS
jgi:hypothetical protein